MCEDDNYCDPLYILEQETHPKELQARSMSFYFVEKALSNSV